MDLTGLLVGLNEIMLIYSLAMVKVPRNFFFLPYLAYISLVSLSLF